MDRFDKMYQIQRTLQEKIDKIVVNAINTDDLEQKQNVSKNQVLYMADEAFEVLRELNYKYWRKKKDVNRENLLEELVDVRKFLMNIELIWGFTPEEIFNKFLEKTDINISRSKELNNEE